MGIQILTVRKHLFSAGINISDVVAWFFFPIKCLNKERAGGWNCPRKVLQKNPEYSDKYHIKQNKRGRKTVRGIKPDILFLTC